MSYLLFRTIFIVFSKMYGPGDFIIFPNSMSLHHWFQFLFQLEIYSLPCFCKCLISHSTCISTFFIKASIDSNLWFILDWLYLLPWMNAFKLSFRVGFLGGFMGNYCGISSPIDLSFGWMEDRFSTRSNYDDSFTLVFRYLYWDHT